MHLGITNLFRTSFHNNHCHCHRIDSVVCLVLFILTMLVNAKYMFTTAFRTSARIVSRPLSSIIISGSSLSPASSSSSSSSLISHYRWQSQIRRSMSNNFYSQTAQHLEEFLVTVKQPKYRAKQIREWVYDRGISDFSQMLNIPHDLRNQLSQEYQFGCMSIASELVSKDGTRKRAYKLHDGQVIESVLMPYRDGRLTACISSQAGCAMKCAFCATGQMGFSRQLSSTEIFEQVLHFYNAAKKDNKRISNVVMMGMGEPLGNYDNVMTAVRRMNTELGIGARHITISTVGLVPKIYDLAEEDIQVNLAISLHQTVDDKRSALMPVNKRFPIATLMEACRHYIAKTNRRVSFEWALIRGQTDSPDTAHQLGVLLSGMLCHVNLIPLNPTSGFNGTATDEVAAAEFIRILDTYKIPATMRVRKGIDIAAGCGQLSAEIMRRRRVSSAVETSSEVADGNADSSIMDNKDETRAGNDESGL